MSHSDFDGLTVEQGESGSWLKDDSFQPGHRYALLHGKLLNSEHGTRKGLLLQHQQTLQIFEIEKKRACPTRRESDSDTIELHNCASQSHA